MDYEQEEQYKDVQAEPQAEDMEIDEDDAPYLDLRNACERQAYAMIKDRSFVHTRAFDLELQIKTGMYEDFANVWHAIGWGNFTPVEEYGSRLLTIQFLCTLREVENRVYFRLFGKEYLLSWKTFAGHLDFNKLWPISLDQACRGFNRHEFLGRISGQVVHGKFAPRCGDIHNPTLQLMHKWLAITLFPRDGVQPVCNDELLILYAMVNKIKISIVQALIKQWLSNFKMTGPIECTS